MTLHESRCQFTHMLALLILKAQELGYEICIGKDGMYHMPGSLHYEGLAADFDLYKNGEYITDSTGHQELGQFWISLGGSWGGYFKGSSKGDFNHYSMSWNGKK